MSISFQNIKVRSDTVLAFRNIVIPYAQIHNLPLPEDKSDMSTLKQMVLVTAVSVLFDRIVYILDFINYQYQNTQAN